MTSVLPPLKEDINPPAVTGDAEKKKNVFPLSTWGGVQTMVTSYSMDYGKKDGTPSEKRPCSSTRRNRPHPSKFFMNWRVPSKPILNNRLTSFEPYAAEYSDILQNFNEEYRGKDDSRPKRKGTPSAVYKDLNEDKTLELIERLKISGKPDETFPLSHLNPEAISLVTNLLKKATPQEQEELEKVFGFSSAREKDCQDFPSYSFISPETITVLEHVLQRAGITDNDSAIHFLLSISQVLMSISNSSIPIPRPRPPTAERERLRKHTLRSAPIHSANFLLPKHRDGICALCNKVNLNNELQNISEKRISDISKSARSYLENVPRLPTIRAPRRSMFLRPRKPNYPKVENKFATFVLPHRPIPRSFTIHPEWH